MCVCRARAGGVSLVPGVPGAVGRAVEQLLHCFIPLIGSFFLAKGFLGPLGLERLKSVLGSLQPSCPFLALGGRGGGMPSESEHRPGV